MGVSRSAMKDESSVVVRPARNVRGSVAIPGDKSVSHGRVVWVLDVVKSLKVTSFAIQIDPAGLIPPAAP